MRKYRYIYTEKLLMWNVKGKMMPIFLMNPIKIVSEVDYLEDIPGKQCRSELQKTAILGRAHILSVRRT
jgi:hypothetical protein